MDIEDALTMSCEVDWSGYDMKVHEESNDLGREEAMDIMQVQLTTGIIDLGIRPF